MKPSVAVAVSGGVDSLMAAYILKSQGYPVMGVHFLTGYETQPPKVESIAEQIGMPLEVIDLSETFDQVVVDYFVQTYRSGMTPNPCLRCNPVIKFERLFEHVQHRGVEKIATGHYARIEKGTDGRLHLLRGSDLRKDQSYFLAFLTQAHLSRALLPLGTLKKTEVRKLASDKGLKPVTQRESQDVCFIKGRRYTDFLAGRSEMRSTPGDIVDLNGNKLGVHQGLHRFTIGQRRGINCPASEPYYVLRLDIHSNRLVVGHRPETLATACRVESINWLQPCPPAPIAVKTRVRYRHEAAPSVLYPQGQRDARIVFDQTQSAVTPGQGAVFYRDDEVLGGGFIREADPKT